MATHSDPPRLVIRTLRVLLDQDWPSGGYEIIVMDNNTADPALWRPVESFCTAHPGRITFLHRIHAHRSQTGQIVPDDPSDFILLPGFIGKFVTEDEIFWRMP